MIRLNHNSVAATKFAVNASGAGVLLCVVVLYLLLIYRPWTQTRKDAELRADQLTVLSSKAKTVQAQHAAIEKQLATLRTEVANVRSQMPTLPADGDFLQTLTTIAEEESLLLVDYRRGQALALPTHSQIELHLKCIGTYETLCRFIHRVNQFPRLTRFTQVILHASDNSDKYPFELRLVLFYGLHPPTTASVASNDERSSG